MIQTQALTHQHFKSPDYLELIEGEENRNAIAQIRLERDLKLHDSRMEPFFSAAEYSLSLQPSNSDLAQSTVKIGASSDLASQDEGTLRQHLQAFCPWKKGPFNLFGMEIDAEWRSDWKWERLEPHISNLKDRRVADIGCHNGYFMFRMLEHEPKKVIGFEPVPKHSWNFQMLQNWVRSDRLNFELLGVEHIHFYPRFFDSIFCLGILYHHTDPVGLLRKIHHALRPKGELIVDCQGIAGDLPVALTPQKRYAKAKGIWFLPTQSCLENWMRRAGFQNIRFVFSEPLSVNEQRRTEWANIDSLAEFLSPQDSSLTVEGYPAPWRFYAIASRG